MYFKKMLVIYVCADKSVVAELAYLDSLASVSRFIGL